MTELLHKYFPIPKTMKQRKGLSERYVRAHYERKGYLVWRGAMLNAHRREELYPNVERKYSLLDGLMRRRHPDDWEYLQYLARQSGMPDFLIFKEEFVFIECKLGHEQLSPTQKKCIARIKEAGFSVEIITLVDDCTKNRKAVVDINTREKNVLDKQMRLKLKW